MKKLTSIILSLLLILVLVTATGAKSTLLAQAEENQTQEVYCDPSEKIAWFWGLLDIQKVEDAPASILFIWPDGSYEEASLSEYDPTKEIAYYGTTNNLNVVPDGWYADGVADDQLARIYYGCPDPTVTTSPSVTTEVTQSIIPSVTTDVTLSVSPSVTITESVTPSVEVTTSVIPTEEVTNEEENVITETPTPTKTTEATATPTSAPASNDSRSNIGGVSNIVPASTSPVAASSAPSTAQVLGARTMAKAGSFDQTVMNLSGIFGMLFTAAGSLIYAKRRTTKNA